MPVLWKLVIFVIKPNPICTSNNPKLQNFFKKSEVASKRQALSIVVKSAILDLIELPSHNFALVFTTNKPARKASHRGLS